jgi:hypothetical protein
MRFINHSVDRQSVRIAELFDLLGTHRVREGDTGCRGGSEAKTCRVLRSSVDESIPRGDSGWDRPAVGDPPEHKDDSPRHRARRVVVDLVQCALEVGSLRSPDTTTQEGSMRTSYMWRGERREPVRRRERRGPRAADGQGVPGDQSDIAGWTLWSLRFVHLEDALVEVAERVAGDGPVSGGLELAAAAGGPVVPKTAQVRPLWSWS